MNDRFINSLQYSVTMPARELEKYRTFLRNIGRAAPIFVYRIRWSPESPVTVPVSLTEDEVLLLKLCIVITRVELHHTDTEVRCLNTTNLHNL